MRGIQPNKYILIVTMRITPAYAGNTQDLDGDGMPDKDHPRVCGEYTLIVSDTGELQGSPPRMRGIRGNFPFFVSSLRITPAYAGNTLHQVLIY